MKHSVKQSTLDRAKSRLVPPKLRGRLSSIPCEALDSFEFSFDVVYAHNSTTIEGNTLALVQAKAILEEDLSIGGLVLTRTPLFSLKALLPVGRCSMRNVKMTICLTAAAGVAISVLAATVALLDVMSVLTAAGTTPLRRLKRLRKQSRYSLTMWLPSTARW